MGQQMQLKDISPGALILDYGPSGHENLEIRPMLGTINVNVEDALADVFEEEFGDAPVDTVEKGTVITIEAPFTRWDIRDLRDLYPTKCEFQSGDVLFFKNLVGYDYFANSRNMVIRPIINNVLSTDRATWVYFFHVHPYNAWTLGWDRENQRVTMVNFKVYPKQSGTNIGRLFSIGMGV